VELPRNTLLTSTGGVPRTQGCPPAKGCLGDANNIAIQRISDDRQADEAMGSRSWWSSPYAEFRATLTYSTGRIPSTSEESRTCISLSLVDAHSCLGAQLARMEAQVVLRQPLDSTSRFELLSEELPLHPSPILRGYTALPLRLTPRESTGPSAAAPPGPDGDRCGHEPGTSFWCGVHAGQVLDVSVEPLLSVKPVDDREYSLPSLRERERMENHEAGTFAGLLTATLT